jgi:phthalate 4,5-dioxygenase oxygenase subunit
VLTAEENELLTRVGSETPMGKLLRRYWMPALMSDELEADGAPKRVELLGENLVAFRDTKGRVGVMDEACPHRGASLVLARNEECGLRCLYHGFKIDVTGKIVDTPAEPEESDFKDRIKHIAYPVREAGGMVWAYLGPRDAQPAFPSFEWLTFPPEQIYVMKLVQGTNWVQGVEGLVDSAHIHYLHSRFFGAPENVGIPGAATSSSELITAAGATLDGRPRLEIENTHYGFRYAAIRRPIVDRETRRHLRITHFVAPFYALLPSVYASRSSLQFFVPMDDVTTAQYFVAYSFKEPLTDKFREQLALMNGRSQLGSGFRPRGNRSNNWLQDRDSMKSESGTGIDGVALEDVAVQESMGAIYDRTKEHVGTSDVAVIRMRRILIDAARRLQRGETQGLIGFSGAFEALRGLDCTAPVEIPWQALDENRGQAPNVQRGNLASTY